MRSNLVLPPAPHLNVISCLAPSRSVHCSMYGPLWLVRVVYKSNPTPHSCCLYSSDTILQPSLWPDEAFFRRVFDTFNAVCWFVMNFILLVDREYKLCIVYSQHFLFLNVFQECFSCQNIFFYRFQKIVYEADLLIF